MFGRWYFWESALRFHFEYFLLLIVTVVAMIALRADRYIDLGSGAILVFAWCIALLLSLREFRKDLNDRHLTRVRKQYKLMSLLPALIRIGPITGVGQFRIRCTVMNVYRSFSFARGQLRSTLICSDLVHNAAVSITPDKETGEFLVDVGSLNTHWAVNLDISCRGKTRKPCSINISVTCDGAGADVHLPNEHFIERVGTPGFPITTDVTG